MSVLHSLYRFFTSSRFTLERFSVRWLSILQVRSVFYVLVILYSLIISYAMPELVESMQPIKLQTFILGDNTLFIVLLAVVIGPLMEELLFRAGMKWWGRNVSFLLWAILFWLIKYFLYDYLLSFQLSQFYLSLVVYSLYILCVIIVFQLIKPFLPSISRRYSSYPWFIFRSLTILFGFIHLSNFSFSQWSWSFVLLIVPQIILWVMLGFVRMNWWLWSSIWLHMFHNLVQLIPLLIIKQIVWSNSTIATYIPNTKSLPDLSLSYSWTLLSWLYGGVLFVVVWWNVYKEIKGILQENPIT